VAIRYLLDGNFATVAGAVVTPSPKFDGMDGERSVCSKLVDAGSRNTAMVRSS
jgi:hypothetical protein